MEIERYIEDKNIAYRDDRMILFNQISEVKKFSSSLVKAEWYIVMLCLEGKASLSINNKMYTLARHNVLICHPEMIVEHSMVDMYFNCCGFCLSPDYIQQMFVISANNWNVRRFLEDNPILSLDDNECKLFLQYYDLIKSKLESEPHEHLKELTDALLIAFMYEFHDSMKKHIKINPPRYNSADNLFSSFIDLLSHSYPKDRSVAYYADKLFVTPKYLSSVSKETCGKTASEVITQYVKRDIEYLLKCPNKSIKEIANELNFANLSFFGKYVKRNFGFSPKEFRENIIKTAAVV